MDCEVVSSKLLDLVYGEVDSAEMSSLEAHLASCDSCTRSLSRLEGGLRLTRKLAMVEPPSDVLDAIRAAASARAARVERALDHEVTAEHPRTDPTHEPAQPDPEARTFWGRLVGFLGSFAMGPQVAMATLLLLMVGIGLWSVPHLREPAVSRSATIIEPETSGEVSPSAGRLQPAEPLAFDFDPRTRRLAPIDDKDEPSALAPPATPAIRPEPMRPAAPIERRSRAEPAPIERSRAGGPIESAEYAIAPARARRSVAPQPSAAEDESPDVAASPMVGDERAEEARAESGPGADAECVRQYQALVGQDPTHEQTELALIELARCQRRVGEPRRAERTLERARRHASARAQASDQLGTAHGERPPSATSAGAAATVE